MKRTTLVSSALGALLATTLLSPSPAQAAAPLPYNGDKTIQVIQHNPDAQGPGPAIQYAIANGGVDAITFQELCESQKAELEAAGYTVHWSKQIDPVGSGCTKGNAIATPRGQANTQTRSLMTRVETGTGDERIFKLLCLDLVDSGVGLATVCTTHFPLDYNGDAAPTGLENRNQFADDVKAIVNKRISDGRKVILTGDFNSLPNTSPMARFYAYDGGNGMFVEGDPENRRKFRDMLPTTDNGRKLDYFFASEPTLGSIYKQIGSAYDPVGHYPVLGTATY